jgi:transcription elongation GreA/GreB family factor
MNDKQQLKKVLFNHCQEYVSKQIAIINNALQKAQEASHEETKNSAGDKYETGLAMAQREEEFLGSRLTEALELQQTLLSIDPKAVHLCVEPGALVETSLGMFYIAIAADELTVENEEYCPISIVSPIGQALHHLSAGSSGSFRGKDVKILNIW